MACVRNKSLVSAECIDEDLSANNKEYMVLGVCEGRNIISNKNEPKQFKNGKQLTLEKNHQEVLFHSRIFFSVSACYERQTKWNQTSFI